MKKVTVSIFIIQSRSYFHIHKNGRKHYDRQKDLFAKCHVLSYDRLSILSFDMPPCIFKKQCPEATVTLTAAVWKLGVSKQGILKSPVSHVVNFLGWIKLIFDTAD